MLHKLLMLHKRAMLLMLAGALAIVWLGACTDIDMRLAHAMYDQPTRSFPWRHAWLADTFGHGYLKTLLTVMGAVVIGAAAWDCFRPLRRPLWWRLRLRVLALSAVLVPLVVSLLKQRSDSHCPWDLADFGGSEPYVRLLEAMPAGVQAGHCLPGGHASGGLWLIALAVFWLPHRPRMAAGVGVSMLGFGFAMGWMQQLRGAHFLTHTLWSAWIACAIVGTLYVALVNTRARRTL